MKKYNKYKESNVAWLGEIPEHWDIDRAKNMFEKQNREVDASHDTITCFRDGVVTLRKNRRTTGFTESLKEIGYQGICKGDLVIHQMDAFAGAVGVSDSDGKSTPVYSVCTPKGKFNNYYYAHVIRKMALSGYIQSLYRGIRERSSDFRFETFARQYLPIPSEEEQEQIVRYLDWKVTLADKFVAEKRKQIELLKEYRQAEINKTVTKGLNPDAPMRDSGIDWIGDVPSHRNLRRFATVFSEVKDINSECKYTAPLQYKFGELVYKNITINDDDMNTINKYTILKPNDIVVNGLNLNYDFITQRVAISNIEGVITSAYIALRPNDLIFPRYSYYYLKSMDDMKLFNGLGTGIRLTLSFKELKRLYIHLPSFDEQQQIVTYLDIILERVKKAIEDIEQQIKRVTEYKTSLISDVVTGKVDVRDIKITNNQMS